MGQMCKNYNYETIKRKHWTKSWLTYGRQKFLKQDENTMTRKGLHKNEMYLLFKRNT